MSCRNLKTDGVRCPPKLLPQSRIAAIYAWMQGKAEDGGVTSPEAADEFEMTMRQASAVLCRLERYGLVVCVDREPLNYDHPSVLRKRKVYVRHDERADDDGLRDGLQRGGPQASRPLAAADPGSAGKARERPDHRRDVRAPEDAARQYQRHPGDPGLRQAHTFGRPRAEQVRQQADSPLCAPHGRKYRVIGKWRHLIFWLDVAFELVFIVGRKAGRQRVYSNLTVIETRLRWGEFLKLFQSDAWPGFAIEGYGKEIL